MKTVLLVFSILISAVAHAQVTANAGPDNEICRLDTLNVIGIGLSANDTGSYQWKNLRTNIIVSNDKQLKTRLITAGNEQFELKVTRIIMGNTYTDYDTMDVLVYQEPGFVYQTVPILCRNQCELNLSKRYTAIGISNSVPGVRDSNLLYYSKNPIKKHISGDKTSGFVYQFCHLINSQIPGTGYRDTICYSYTDPKGCFNRECRMVRVYPDPPVELAAANFCQNQDSITLNQLILKPTVLSSGISNFRCIDVPEGSNLDTALMVKKNASGQVLKGHQNHCGKYMIEYQFKDKTTGCSARDTNELQVMCSPNIKLMPIPKQCINWPLLALDSFVTDSVTGLKLSGCKWQTVEYMGSRNRAYPSVALRLDSSIRNQKYFNPKYGPGQFIVKVAHSETGCVYMDSIKLLTNGLPIVQISVPDTVCSNDPPFELFNINPSGAVGKWSGNCVINDRSFDPSLSNGKERMRGPYSLKFEYTNPLTSCTSSDSQKILVQTATEFNIHSDIRKSNSHFIGRFNLQSMTGVISSQDRALWYFSNGYKLDTSATKSFEVPFSDTGWYSVRVLIQGGVCVSADSVTFKVGPGTSVQNAQPPTLFTFSPNPAQNKLTINATVEGTIRIISSNGQILLDKTTLPLSDTIDINSFNSGIYTLIFQDKEGKLFHRIMVKE